MPVDKDRIRLFTESQGCLSLYYNDAKGSRFVFTLLKKAKMLDSYDCLDISKSADMEPAQMERTL
jgi:hypothetical protein